MRECHVPPTVHCDVLHAALLYVALHQWLADHGNTPFSLSPYSFGLEIMGMPSYVFDDSDACGSWP